VARIGWPFSPKTSQSITGFARYPKSFRSSVFTRSSTFALPPPGCRHAREVALHVGHEHRNADGAEALGERLQGHGLAGSGRARDQAVPVGHCR
jgi:hypothetical protein